MQLPIVELEHAIVKTEEPQKRSGASDCHALTATSKPKTQRGVGRRRGDRGQGGHGSGGRHGNGGRDGSGERNGARHASERGQEGGRDFNQPQPYYIHPQPQLLQQPLQQHQHQHPESCDRTRLAKGVANPDTSRLDARP